MDPRDDRHIRRIEASLRNSAPRLSAMFDVFTRLEARETMPQTEHLTRRAVFRPAVVLVFALGIIFIAAAATLAITRTSACTARAYYPKAPPAAVAGHRLPPRVPDLPSC